MSALGKRVLDLAEQQGLLDGQAIGELRKKVAESKFVITPEAIAKVLVDHGHLTPFQARKLVAQAQGDQSDPVEQKAVQRSQPKPRPQPDEELMLAEDAPLARRPKPHVSEEIVELEAVEPVPRPAPTGDRAEPRQVDSAGATADDFVDLEPVDPTPAVRGRRWKTDPQPMNETIEMTPLEGPGSASEVVELEPIDDLFGPDPFAAPVSHAARPAAPPPAAAASAPQAPSADIFGKPTAAPRPKTTLTAPPRRAGKNVWDSPLLLIGGGIFGVVLVLFLLLLFALTRGTAAEMFAKAEEEYRNGSFTSASAVYTQFLEKYPGDPNASLARVRRGMATLRNIADGGKNPSLSLETAQQVLPQIEAEEKFGEARGELASILPNIADGVTTRALETDDPARKQHWVELANDALALVNNPSYLPASLRKERENQISRIVDKLKVAERGIEQDRQLATAVAKINDAAEKGQASEGYALRSELLRSYPALASDSQLVAAVARLGQRERELVKVSQGGPAPFKDDHAAPGETVLLAAGGSAPSGGVTPGLVLVEGAVYGFDAKTGAILWRRHVGYESTVQPIAIKSGSQAAVALVDGKRQELVMVDAASGLLRWRHKLGDEISGIAASPARVFVTTHKGRITAVDVASGDIVCSAQLPQGAVVGPALGKSRLFQLGEHSTLFVLDGDSLNCTHTFYLGHQAGSLLVSPAAVGDQLLVMQSPADDYSLLQVLTLDAKSKQWAAAGQPRRLKGRITTPPVLSGGRVAVTTDLGQIAVYQLESGAAEPLRSIAGAAATESSPITTYAELDKNRLYVASRRRMLYEVQESLQQLSIKWTENQDDRFAAPIGLYGDVVVVARRREGASGVLLEGCNATTGQTLWTTTLAVPVAGLFETAGDKALAITQLGSAYELAAATVTEGRAGEAVFATNSGPIAAASRSADGQTLAWNAAGGAQVFLYDLASRAGSSLRLPAAAAAPVAVLSGHIAAPLVDGRVSVLSGDDSQQPTAPFLPALVPDALPLWSQPLPLPGGNSFLISDGRETVYAVSREEGSHPRLVAKGAATTDAPVDALVWAGSAAVAVLRLEKSDAIVGFDSDAKQAFAPLPLSGRVTAGPFGVGGLTLLTSEPDGFLCVTAEGKLHWKQPLSRGPLAGAPIALPDGDLLVAFQSGDVCRLDAASGKELTCQSAGESLLGPLCLIGTNVYLSGSDGVVHRLAVPSRQ